MADLDSLIRVRRHTIEQKQKFLAELFRQAEELAVQKKALLDQLTDEQERIKDMGAEMAAFFGSYAGAVKGRVYEIDEAVEKLEVRIKIAQDDMRDAFAELKKIETLQERREEEEARELLKKETQMLDEIAIDGFMRKGDEA